MIVAVKIYNPESCDFMCAGKGWNKKGKSWSSLRDAKLAVCPNYGFSYKEAKSEFWLFYDDGKLEKIPVYDYFIEYFERKTIINGASKIEIIKKLQYLKNIKKENEKEKTKCQN